MRKYTVINESEVSEDIINFLKNNVVSTYYKQLVKLKTR